MKVTALPAMTAAAALALAASPLKPLEAAVAGGPWEEPRILGTSENAVTLGRDLDGDGDADEVNFRLEVIEVEEAVFPGRSLTSWVFAPEGSGMTPVARLPSPTLRIEEGDRVRITLLNSHYLPHTIHLHGTASPDPTDLRPLRRVNPGEAFTFEFIAVDPGTHLYHCHVLDDVHPPMGLVGMVVIEPNRPGNRFRHLVTGAGRIPDLAKAVADAGYAREYSVVAGDVDDRLNRIPQVHTDVDDIELLMHGRYDAAKRRANILLLNGRSFPFTLRDTPIEVAAGERVKLRVLNGGMRTINLHAHGHRPILTHLGGEAIDADLRVPREHIEIGPGVTAEIELQAGDEKVRSPAPGVWIVHDHGNTASAARGGNPAGDSTAIVYAGFTAEDGLPRIATDLGPLFAPNYYEDGGHSFDPALFETVSAAARVREYHRPARDHAAAEHAAGERRAARGGHLLESHQFITRACPKPRGFRRIHLKAGSRFAAKGEAYAFEPRVLRAEPCETVELVMENGDAIRHAFMLPGLNPMVALEFAGPDQRSVRFTTPDEDITLEFHCHVAIHEKMGMRGKLIVGKGGERRHGDETARRYYAGIGVVRGVQVRKSRLVIDHEEIKDFMAPMVMSYRVQPASLLQGLTPGDKISFTIDAGERAIVAVVPVREGAGVDRIDLIDLNNPDISRTPDAENQVN